MTPAPGERLLRFVGDRIKIQLQHPPSESLSKGWQARFRTNLGRAKVLRHEIIHAHSGKVLLHDASWWDIPMSPEPGGWSVSLPLAEVGYFEGKAYALDPAGRQHWPGGPNLGVSVHPDRYRTGNIIYCAFARMFGPTKTAVSTRHKPFNSLLAALDQQDYTVIPPSGKFRDLIRELPHIIDSLGCRILHLLPVNPTPTTYARFGRFGSPYACQDLLAIDPALIEFDRRTTGVDQFRELAYATHLCGASLFLDVVINHTGWGSTLQEQHPEWFMRAADGSFTSPGAWNVTWEDLAELHHRNPALWEHLADVFLEWCRRGVDGFRCDAGYKIPVPAWRYITARVQEEFPETIFLLEGLGGPWEVTEDILTTGGMQWAYSELFQNYSGPEVARYLDYAHRQSQRIGLYVHYSETHDNPRLAEKGRSWSLLRNRLCALTSVGGAFGFTCGVEWLAPEKINVHDSRGLAWENPNNIIPELKRLHQLLAQHPCFFSGASLARLSPENSPVYALSRTSPDAQDHLLILVNTDPGQAQTFHLPNQTFQQLGAPHIDLLDQPSPVSRLTPNQELEWQLDPGQVCCLAPTREPIGLGGDRYRQARARAAWAISTLRLLYRIDQIGPCPWPALADMVHTDVRAFLTALSHLEPDLMRHDLELALQTALHRSGFQPVVTWKLDSRRRVTPVPPDHWLLIDDPCPFRATFQAPDNRPTRQLVSIPTGTSHIACLPPGQVAGDAILSLERYAEHDRSVQGQIRFLELPPSFPITFPPGTKDFPAIALLTNRRGAMARIPADLGRVYSKYDCILGANLHPDVPIDRHVFVKRLRAWVIADGFITPLDAHNLIDFSPGPPARWRFVASAGNDRAVEIHLTADMLDGANTTLLQFHRPARTPPFGHDLAPDCRVSLTVRFDIEDRNFHTETHYNDGANHHFATHCHPLSATVGFEFTPDRQRRLQVVSQCGAYHPEPEWSRGLFHPIEASRGQEPYGDAFSPGWFDLPMPKGQNALLSVSAEPNPLHTASLGYFIKSREEANERAIALAKLPTHDRFGRQLALALQAFVVRRGSGKTVIAGYPWFLDWGRDTLIAARGLLTAGLTDTVKDLLLTFARLTENGTLPNTLRGEDASNRSTSDAPLWFGVVCEEYATRVDPSLYATPLNQRRRTLQDALLEIAAFYRDGTPNGIRMDPDSALIWSPGHFTWMDTNFPACTPREGYPVEIQVLWIQLLRQLARLDLHKTGQQWSQLATRAQQSFLSLYPLPDRGYLSDVLLAKFGQTAAQATPDTALRSNGLLAVCFSLVTGPLARRSVQAALEHLLVPGALRSLAPLPVTPPLPIHAPDGRLLNDPGFPYRGRYEGDEDNHRKLAYHNGTAWTWTLPSLCEALARAWDFSPEAVSAAQAYLASMDRLLNQGCLGQLPEILDGDAPHTQRGCDAQAWAASEALRVWHLLHTHKKT